MILTDDRIHKIALSVYTKGQSKRLDKEKRKVAELRNKFDAAFDAFAQKPTPKWHELNYKRDYNEEKTSCLNGKMMCWKKKKSC